jgi:hypothetical protein
MAQQNTLKILLSGNIESVKQMYLLVQFMDKTFCQAEYSSKWQREFYVSPPR